MATTENELRERNQKTQDKGENNDKSDRNNAANTSEDSSSSVRDTNAFQYRNVGPYRSATEYSQAVQQWLWQYHTWNQMNWFYMTLPMYACSYGFPPVSASTQRAGFPGISSFAAGVPNGMPPNVGSQPNAQPQAQPQAQRGTNRSPTNSAPNQGETFKIPPLWKRVFAEFIDFFLLFIVKLAVTIFFVEYIGLVDLRHYDLEYLMTTDMDYNMAFAMTSELVAMEIVNRVFICVFETLCLRKGLGGMIGGTTPGKRVMGLKVISCHDVTDLPGNTVRVLPAGNIGTWNAFVRTVIKNFSLAFFFPVCLTVFFFQHNRAAYDIISHCIVVESTEFRQPRAARR